MALFDFGSIGKKKDTVSQPASQMPDVPVPQVTAMKNQGMSDNQIIQTLQRDGYKTHQIFDAMSQADLLSGAPRPLDDMPVPPEPDASQQFQAQPQMGGQFQQQAPQQFANQQPDLMPQFPTQQQVPTQYPPFTANASGYPPQPTEPQAFEPDYEKIEEIAESIIEEKWTDLSKGVSKIIEWKERTDLKINELDTKIGQLKQSFDELNKNMMNRMSEYDKNIGSVGSDIKAMEKVFQQMLPSFTENVNELSRLTRNIKDKK